MRIGLIGLGRIGTQHATTLLGLPEVSTLVVADLDPSRASALAERPDLDHGAVHTGEGIGQHTAVEQVAVEQMLDAELDGLVIANSSDAHGEWVRRSVAAGIPTFCEKPLATTIADTIDVARHVLDSGVEVQVGFQRRFDAGYRAARDAVRSGHLGFVHTVRAMTNDQTPPPAEYLPRSGGIFRDCSVHDADAIRFVTGGEVETVYATGSNRGAAYFSEAGDVDTGAALLTLTDGTLAHLGATRYNGAGHDVRMEVASERGTIGVGYDASLAVRSAEPGATQPTGPVHSDFFGRFRPAFAAEFAAFARVAAGTITSPCTVLDAVEAFRIVDACALSLREGRPVALTEIPDLRPTPQPSTKVIQ